MAFRDGLMRSGSTSASVLSLLLLLPCATHAAQFTVTSYYISSQLIEAYTLDDGFRGTLTDTMAVPITISPSVTIPPAAATTTTRDGNLNNNVEVVQVFISSGAIPESDYATVTRDDGEYTKTERTTTDYMETYIYTAPTYCASSFVAAVETYVSVPPELTNEISIKDASTSISSYWGTTWTVVEATLATTITLTGTELDNDYNYRRFIASCTNPNPFVTPSAEPGDGSGDDGDDGDDRNNDGGFGRNGRTGGNDDGFGIDDEDTCNSAWNDCGQLPYWGYCLVTILPAAFLFGFIESYLWFGSMMEGHGALRFGTVTWILLCLPIVFLTRHVPPRSEDDQKVFKPLWKEKKFGEKLSLWLRWGLRYKYPVHLLGIHPTYERGDPEAEDRLHKLYYENSDFSTQPQQPQMAYMGQPMPPATMAHGSPQQQPALPPRTYNRRSHNSTQATRSVASESALASVPEESASNNVESKNKGKSNAGSEQEPVSPIESYDPQPGRAPPEEPSIAPSSETSPTTKDNEDKA